MGLRGSASALFGVSRLSSASTCSCLLRHRHGFQAHLPRLSSLHQQCPGSHGFVTLPGHGLHHHQSSSSLSPICNSAANGASGRKHKTKRKGSRNAGTDAGSQEHLLDLDLEADGPMSNSRQRMMPPDVQADLDEANASMNAVVKVYCVHTEPNFSLPWQRLRQHASTSSGFLVAADNGERWLLTNAHSVAYHSQVKVKRRGDDRKFLAQVLAIGTECDIALLTVEDQEFWQDVEPLQLGPLPRLQDAVAVIGYPIGGDTISVTSGVVSRIEVTSYVHGTTELLAVQIDAAINSGNSGGPVFNGFGQCVGIAFQSLSGGDAENIGWLIPTPVIQHFLTDFRRNGHFTGFPQLGVRWQRMESDALKASHGMTSGQKGVLVRSVAPLADAARVLKPGDVIMKFDGVQVASDGTVPFRTGERIAFNFLVSQKYTGEAAILDVLRDGASQQLDINLTRPSALVPLHLNNTDPSYVVIAGIVFTCLCEPYLISEYGSDYLGDSPVKLLDQLLHGRKEQPEQQIVVLSQVLACNTTLGYEDLYNLRVHKFNGTAVRSLAHLAHLATACTDKYMRFDLDHSEVVVLETAQGLTLTFASTGPAGNVFFSPSDGESVPTSKPFTLRWSPASSGLIDLVLKQGLPPELETLYPIAQDELPFCTSHASQHPADYLIMHSLWTGPSNTRSGLLKKSGDVF
ncbi:hypothetical protein WJX84_004330 [Apatococcus fuscideae]|uniref:Protease Do-like PDZ domain-containing protein n=1 Tax=Apatococcus fuscideae TaxID=2026836 RepID=A0AAW1S871_9CHLO